MSFRRDEKTANHWRKRREEFPDLLVRAGLPNAVLQDDHSYGFFLQEGLFLAGDNSTRLIDAMSFLSDKQKEALYELLSCLLTKQEQGVSELWKALDSQFRMK